MATYYVNAATGNDSNNGLTSGTAWATLSKATSVAGPVDILSIAAGSYAPSPFPGIYKNNGLYAAYGIFDNTNTFWQSGYLDSSGNYNASPVMAIGPWDVTSTHVGPFLITTTHLGKWKVS